MNHAQNSRREFLIQAAKTTAAGGALGAIALGGLKLEANSETVIKGQSTKEEILYQKTPHWEAYYATC